MFRQGAANLQLSQIWEKEREMIDVHNRISKKFAVVDDYWRGYIYMYNCIPYWWFLGRMDASTILMNSWHTVGADDNVSYVSNFALVVKPIIHIELKSFTLNLRLIIFFFSWKLRYIIRFLNSTSLNFLIVQTQIQTIRQIIIIIDQMLKRFNQNRR